MYNKEIQGLLIHLAICEENSKELSKCAEAESLKNQAIGAESAYADTRRWMESQMGYVLTDASKREAYRL